MINKICLYNPGSYEDVLNLQLTEFKSRLECRKNDCPLPEDVVFFVQHQPVYTIGRHGKKSHLLLDNEELRKRNIEFIEADRGGDITYHGPGQLTVYPIIDLQRYHLGVKDYVHLLEEAVIRTIGEYAIIGERIEGKTGVWIGKGSLFERKICAIGIKCSRFITMHGLALNVSTAMDYFSGIIPCGLSQGVTSLEIETGEKKNITEVGEKLWKNLISLLQPRIPSPKIV